MTINDGKTVEFHYVVVADGEEFDRSTDTRPLKYVHGDGTINPIISRCLEGMCVGERKQIEILPDESFGQLDMGAVVVIPKTGIDSRLVPEVGMFLKSETAGSGALSGRIVKVKKDHLVIDYNHPLAGKSLVLQLEVLSIN